MEKVFEESYLEEIIEDIESTILALVDNTVDVIMVEDDPSALTIKFEANISEDDLDDIINEACYLLQERFFVMVDYYEIRDYNNVIIYTVQDE